MARFFREPDRRQRYLLPVDMMDWLPEGDIVHLIVDAVALMDLSGFEATCKVGKAGQAPFSPRVLLALLIYASATASVRAARSSGSAGAMSAIASSSAPPFPTTA